MNDEKAVEALVKQIYRLGAVRRQLLSEALPAIGGQGFTALAALYRLGPSRVSDIAGYLVVDLSVASRQIQTLTKAGYVERRPDPADGRAHLLSLSESGLQALRESHHRMVEASTLALDGWQASEIANLVSGLEKLRADFLGTSAATAPPPPPTTATNSGHSPGELHDSPVGASK